MAATETRRRTLSPSPLARRSRRGEHAAQNRDDRQVEREAAATPAMHITPNVLIAARGAVGSGRRRDGRRAGLLTAPSNLRRFRA